MSRWSRRRAGPEVYAASRFDEPAFASRYETPGWRRAQANAGQPEAGRAARTPPRVIEGRAIARDAPSAHFAVGARVFHIKFGNGDVVAVDGAEADGRIRSRRPQDGARQLRQRGGVKAAYAAFDFGFTSAA